MFDYSSINPLNPKIKILILICFPCSFHTEEVGRSFCMIMSLILIYFDHSVSYINICIDITRRNLMLITLRAY